MLTYTLSQPNLQQDERLQALYHLAVELSALRSLDSVLNTALRHCLELTGSQFGFVGLNTPDGKALDVVAIQGFHPTEHFYQHNHLIPLRPNIFARVVLENRPVRSANAMLDPQRVGQPRGHPPVGTFLGVPLRIHDAPIGMIGLANRPEPYDLDHEQLLLTYAAQVAIVIRNAQLYEQLTAANEALERKVASRTQELEEAKGALAQKANQLQQLLTETVDVQERERQRIAQDLHDGSNQLLIGAMLELKSARERLASGHLAKAEDSLQKVQTILRQIEAESKRIIRDLRPPTLDALGLVPAIRRYAEQFQHYSDIPCLVQVRGEPVRLSAQMEISIYRLMQEALQNISAHAQASQANISITFSPDSLCLSISDDGRGFDLAAARQNPQGSFGLLSMQERAESLGGKLSLWTEPGQGTRVELSVPK
ncbi:MAG: GAF domain-containing sensor histidine kinase [Anaerolineales bacterium]|nr:GAF domain-containing sensor histidine kinase [Anaerolineales bacterium]